MAQLAFLIVILGLVVDYGSVLFRTNAITAQKASIAALAEPMADYGTAVKHWAASNTSYTGSVSDSTIALPTWIYHASNVSNYVSSGTVYVYFTPNNSVTPNNIAGFLAQQGDVAGINTNGTLYNGTTVVGTVPTAVPTGAAVLVL